MNGFFRATRAGAMRHPQRRVMPGLEPGIQHRVWMGHELSLLSQLFDLPLEPGEVVLPNGVVWRELC